MMSAGCRRGSIPTERAASLRLSVSSRHGGGGAGGAGGKTASTSAMGGGAGGAGGKTASTSAMVVTIRVVATITAAPATLHRLSGG